MMKHIYRLAQYLVLGLFVLGTGPVSAPLIPNPPSRPTPQIVANSTINPLIQRIPDQPQDQFQIPILMYHYLEENQPANNRIRNKLTVSPETFEAQMKWLNDHQYLPITLDFLVQKKVPTKAIILTFDDGYRDFYLNAWPVLKKYNFIATVFLITDLIGQNPYLNPAQIEELKSYGIQFGSHTLNHQDLTKIQPIEAKRQIFDSKNSYQFFCYPSGQYNQSTVNLVKQAGYLAALTTQSGIANQQSDLFLLPRIRVDNSSDFNQLLPL